MVSITTEYFPRMKAVKCTEQCFMIFKDDHVLMQYFKREVESQSIVEYCTFPLTCETFLAFVETELLSFISSAHTDEGGYFNFDVTEIVSVVIHANEVCLSSKDFGYRFSYRFMRMHYDLWESLWNNQDQVQEVIRSVRQHLNLPEKMMEKLDVSQD